jgi:hypothetical protein
MVGLLVERRAVLAHLIRDLLVERVGVVDLLQMRLVELVEILFVAAPAVGMVVAREIIVMALGVPGASHAISRRLRAAQLVLPAAPVRQASDTPEVAVAAVARIPA